MVENRRILGSRSGSSLVVLFDGQTGAWAGSGFFETRFDPGELSTARPGTIADDEEIAGWAGVVAGPAIVVGRAASQSECEIIEGRRICPRQESYSFAEREWYREYEPLRNVTPVYPPTLLLHGKKDTDVPFEQSVLMAEALKRNGVEHDFITNPEWGHGFDGRGMKGPAVREAFTQVLAFLEEYVRP